MIGEQKVPDDIGTNVGVSADLQRGKPRPREIKSQDAQTASVHSPGHSKAVKYEMSEKIRGGED